LPSPLRVKKGTFVLDMTGFWNEMPISPSERFLLKHNFAVISSPASADAMRREGWYAAAAHTFRLDFRIWPSQDSVQAAAPAVITASERYQ
jgi:hypothetical protein